MTKQEIAAQARALVENETFQSVLKSIRDRQLGVFLNSGSSLEEREEAHRMVCAIEAIGKELEKRQTDYAIEQKRKDRDRGND